MDITLPMEPLAVGETVLSSTSDLSVTPDPEPIGDEEKMLGPPVDEGVHLSDKSAQPIPPYGSMGLRRM